MSAVPARRSLARRSVGVLPLAVLCLVAGCQSAPAIRAQSPASGTMAPGRFPGRLSKPRATAIDRVPVSGRPLDEPLTAIRIEGNDTIPEREILKLLDVKPGRDVSEAGIRADIRRLFATRWFFSVDPIYRRENGRLVLVFRVVERPIVKSVRYVGNKRIKIADLEELTGLKPGSPFDVSANREGTRRIQEHYVDEGFAFAHVVLEKGNRHDDRDIVYRITENQKVLVTDLVFEGNNYVYATSAILRTKLRSKRAFFGVALLGGKYNPATLRDDVEALTTYYRGLGFFDVTVRTRVARSDVRFTPWRLGDANLTIEYLINEGTRYTVRSIELDGNHVLPSESLAKNFELTTGEFFNRRWLEADVREMRTQYGQLGRLFASIEPVTRFDDREPGVIDLVYEIDEDKPYIIGPINVNFRGDHPHTKESVVLNRLMFYPGDLADPRLFRLSERRLEGMIFERGPRNGPRIRVTRMMPEELAPREIARGQNDLPFEPLLPAAAPPSGPAAAQLPPAPFDPIKENQPHGDPLNPYGQLYQGFSYGLLDIDVDLTEARSGRVMFGFGVNSDAGVVGSAIIEENNFDLFRVPRSFEDISDGTAFRGGGQRFRIEALPGEYVSRYLLNWSDPFFLDTDYSLSTSGFYYHRFYDDWFERRLGGRIGLGKQLNKQWSLTGSFRLENVKLTERTNVPVLPDLLAEALGESFFSSFRGAVTHDTRDSAFLPAEGHFVQASYEQAFGDFVFPRGHVEARQYFKLSELPGGGGRHVIALRGQIGWTGSDTPIYERFFAGGYQSFRGFDFRGVTPRESGVAVGGRWLLLGGAEYQFPITADETLSGVVFCDTGTVEHDVGIDNYRVTIGAGLRITIPAMGPVPIALDWGIPVIDQDFDQRRMFSFYIGMTR